jgi:hypothetical protein
MPGNALPPLDETVHALVSNAAIMAILDASVISSKVIR